MRVGGGDRDSTLFGNKTVTQSKYSFVAEKPPDDSETHVGNHNEPALFLSGKRCEHF